MIGVRYEVVGPVNAYGIWDYEKKDAGVLYTTLIPGAGISGPEVAYEKPVETRSVFTVRRVMKNHVFPDSSIVYVGTLEGTGFSLRDEVRIEMFRGNEGVGLEPNEKIYRRLE